MTGLIAEEGIKITTLAHGSSIETISPKGGNLEGVYTVSFVPRLVLTTYEMVGVVTTSTRLNSRFKRSMTISRWRRPRNPQRKPRPSTPEDSSSNESEESESRSRSSDWRKRGRSSWLWG